MDAWEGVALPQRGEETAGRRGGLKSGDLVSLGQGAEQDSLGRAGRCVKEKHSLGKFGGRSLGREGGLPPSI